MKKIIEPGSGVDDMGGGMAMGCIKWVAIIAIAIAVILLTLNWFNII